MLVPDEQCVGVESLFVCYGFDSFVFMRDVLCKVATKRLRRPGTQNKVDDTVIRQSNETIVGYELCISIVNAEQQKQSTPVQNGRKQNQFGESVLVW